MIETRIHHRSSLAWMLAAGWGLAALAGCSSGGGGGGSRTPTLESISVTPADPVMTYRGAMLQFTATGTYSDASTEDLTLSAAWSSSDAAVATITDGGLATGGAAGSTTITASSDGTDGTVTLVVRTATVNGQISFPDSDMGWKPSLYDFAAKGGARVRVQGTDISAAVAPSSATAGSFTLADVPWGPVTLIFEEGTAHDVFTQSSKRLEIDVDADPLSGVSFDLVYHWRELEGYPAPWGTSDVWIWDAHFVSEQVAFVLFRLKTDPESIELYRTLDRGETWDRIGQWVKDKAPTKAEPTYPAWWLSFHFCDEDRGVVLAAVDCIPCGACGCGFFHTANGGQSWSFTDLPLTPTGYDIKPRAYAEIDADHLIMAGTVGCGVQGYNAGFYDAVWESDNGGESWALQWASALNSSFGFNGLAANPEGRAVAYRGGALQEFLLRDTQGGWSSQSGGGIRNDGRDVAMAGDSAWVVSVSGAVPNGTYRSLDAGETWEQMSGGLVQDFDFASPLKGFAQAGGPAYVTYDAGETWLHQSAGGAVWPGPMDIWAFDSTHAAWAEGGYSDPNGTSQLFTYVEPLEHNFEILAAADLDDVNEAPGASTVPMASYKLVNHGPEPIRIDGVALCPSEPVQVTTDVTAIELWRDMNADGAVDAGDTLLTRGTRGAGETTMTFSPGVDLTLQPLLPVHVLVTCDLSAEITAAKSLWFSLPTADLSAQPEEGGTPVPASAPAGYELKSRTVTVTP